MNTCALCLSSFKIHDDELEFLKKMEFSFGSTIVNPPHPIHCADCRMLLRTCHRNERNLYKSYSQKSKIPLVTLYHPDPLWGEPYSIYNQSEWRADDFEPMQFGRSFDFSKSLFEQFAELSKAVPRMNLVTLANENSEFTTGTGYCKNCYLINSSENCEDCYYGKLLQKCTDSMDCSFLYDSELCYECFSVYSSYNCRYVLFSQNCSDCYFSSNLSSCKNCFLCTNVHQKQYQVRNRPVSKEEFEKTVSECMGSYERMQAAYREILTIRSSHPQRFANIVQSENCSGDFIENSKNCLECYDVNNSEDCRNVQVGVEVKDNYDCSNMYLKVEKCYQTLGTIEVVNSAYCLFIFHSNDLLYCEYCFHCSNCLGCVGLTRKKYCIFNKQYSETEYNALVPKIIEHMKQTGEWGLYFPQQYSPFGYNESLAHEYAPLTKDEAEQRGFLWRDVIDQKPNVQKLIPANRLPDSIQKIPDDIVQWAITCEASTRPFQVIPQELEYYRTYTISCPHLHPDERHKNRMKLRNPRKLWDRTCGKCSADIQTTYAPDRPETVYCESCYLSEVY